MYRALKKTVQGFPRPQLNLTAANFGTIINAAFNRTLTPPFDPYANSVNYLLASYLIPYVGLTGYVGANPQLQSPTAKRVNFCYVFLPLSKLLLCFFAIESLSYD